MDIKELVRITLDLYQLADEVTNAAHGLADNSDNLYDVKIANKNIFKW